MQPNYDNKYKSIEIGKSLEESDVECVLTELRIYKDIKTLDVSNIPEIIVKILLIIEEKYGENVVLIKKKNLAIKVVNKLYLDNVKTKTAYAHVSTLVPGMIDHFIE